MKAITARQFFAGKAKDFPMKVLFHDLTAQLPLGVSFDSDTWNCIDWARRPRGHRTRNLYFTPIAHPVLRLLAKVWILDGRLKRHIGLSAADLRINAMKAISSALGARDFLTLKTSDFNAAERLLKKEYGQGTVFRLCSSLELVSQWLSLNFGLRLDYSSTVTNPVVHGRYGTDEGREAKLIPLQVLTDLLAARGRNDLIPKDKFFLSLVAVDIGAGFRVGETSTLPVDCVIKEGRLVQIRVLPEKDGKSVARPIDPMIADVVEDAIRYLQGATETGRRIALALSATRCLDWSHIYKNVTAFRYFAGVWAHEWTADPRHWMINPAGAWCEKEKQFIDVVGALKAAGGRKGKAAKSVGLERTRFAAMLKNQEAAIRGELAAIPRGADRGKVRRTWDTDSRVISMMKFLSHTGVMLKAKDQKAVLDIFEDARCCQLQGKAYPKPKLDPEVEKQFVRRYEPVVKRKTGEALLYPHEALLVIQKYEFAAKRSIKVNDYALIIERHIASWLAGEKRSRGTGNHEDSAFRRLGIIDQRTGQIASFGWHQIRHWLNTVYQNGGFTQDQIALLFNRKSTAQNATYDQTSRKARTERVIQGIRDGMMVGIVPDTYHQLAEYSREEAEEYLEGAVRQVNPMPHGDCSLDWCTEPCPHHLSCFKHESEEDRACEYLMIDPNDPSQVEEVKRIHRTSGLQIKVLTEQLQHLGVEESPQLEHFIAIHKGTEAELRKIANCRGDE